MKFFCLTIYNENIMEFRSAIIVIWKKAVFIFILYYQMQHKSPDAVIEVWDEF